MIPQPKQKAILNRVMRIFGLFRWSNLPVLTLVFMFGVQSGESTVLVDVLRIWNSALPENLTSKQSCGNIDTQPDTWVYLTQSGDTLEVIAARFQVRLEDIEIQPWVLADQLIDPGQRLVIHRPMFETQSLPWLLPDSEVVYSPSAVDFDTQDYVTGVQGFLSSHQEYMRSTGLTSAAEIIERVAVENSIHPRLLLALLQYQCGCLTDILADGVDSNYLMGINDPYRRGLYRQLGWTVNQLSLGYYGWRQGLLHELVLVDGSVVSLAPDLNAGSVSIAYLFSRLTDWDGWHQAMDPELGFINLHQNLFAEVWGDEIYEQELFSPGLAQPDLILPFQLDREWSFTSGPHQAWETEGALAALDFAPASEHFGCDRSDAWVLAAADGLVVRSEHNALVLDLDGDGFEGTGWAVLYMHLADYQRVVEGTFIYRGEPVGHPSCEGGPADGTHVHLARKFNGEWIAADGPLPFVMSGWIAHAGYRPYDGSLTRGDQVVLANPLSPAAAFITRSGADLLREAKISRNLWWED